MRQPDFRRRVQCGASAPPAAIPSATLVSSRYALEEARINLEAEEQRLRLTCLADAIRFHDSELRVLPPGVRLPEKDVPILLAAIEAQATHLLTGDRTPFGPYSGRRIEGVLVCLVGDYLRRARVR
jgi:hypothetical protein